jgi:sarcosine oxidase
MTRRSDVVVVGLGAMGSAAGWWLARRGRDVVMLDQFEQGHHRGASHGRSRIFRFGYPEPEYVRLVGESRALWRELEDDTGTPLLAATGAVDHGQPALVRMLAERLAGERVEHELLGRDEAEARWPGARFGAQVLHHPGGGRVDAGLAVLRMQQRAVELGAEARFAEPVEALEVGAGGVVARTEVEEYRAPVAVVACGAWAPKLLAGLVRLPPVRVTEEDVVFFDLPDGWAGRPPLMHYLDPLVYCVPSPAEGLKAGMHMAGRPVDPDDRSASAAAAAGASAAARLTAYAERWLPGLRPEPVGVQTCLYTTTPSEDFVVQRLGPLVVGAGFSGHGFKFTPLIGRMLADLTAGDDSGVPARFAGAAPA